jgi:hypothetical protein
MFLVRSAPRAWRLLGLFVALAVLFAGAYVFLLPDAEIRLSLLRCGIYAEATEKSECVFVLIRDAMVRDGMEKALEMYALASDMYPNTLDIDCHSGIHRVGDIAYYDLYLSNPDISEFSFPKKSMICNRGFFHGIFEHMIQDRTDPAFISQTCNHFKSKDMHMNAVVGTCYHAAGHGLFRHQAESVPKSDWGDIQAFIEPPVDVCQRLPDTTERDRHTCTTGVESIFIQTSLLNEYGFRDPDVKNTLAVCDQMPARLHDSCYEVRSLMVAQMDNDYLKILHDCARAPNDLFRACVRGSIVGLFVNGVNDATYDRALEMCYSPRLASKGATEYCFQRLGYQLQIEYLGDFQIDCSRFPEANRSYCGASARL